MLETWNQGSPAQVDHFLPVNFSSFLLQDRKNLPEFAGTGGISLLVASVVCLFKLGN